MHPGLRVCCCLLIAVSATACDSGGDDAETRRPPTYVQTPRTARPSERPVTAPPAREGWLAFTVIGLQTNIPFLTGTHAEFMPKGRFVRVRVVVENLDRTFHYLRTERQLLVTADGRSHDPDLEAMLIKRQPTIKLEIGGENRIEFDLWYDVPVGARPTAVRFFSEQTDAHGVSVPLP